MPDYKTMYKQLFTAVTEAIEILKQAQIDTEEIFINTSESEENKLLQFKLITDEKDERK